MYVFRNWPPLRRRRDRSFYVGARQVSSLHNLGKDRTENTASNNSSILLNDVLSGLLPADDPGTVDAAACFGRRGNTFTGRSLEMDIFPRSAIAALSSHVTVWWQLSWYSDRMRAGRPGVRFPAEAGIFLFSAAFRRALGPIPPIKCAPGLGRLKRPGREADRLPPSGADVKNGGAIPPLPDTSSWCGA
jgi:hypothetical protein